MFKIKKNVDFFEISADFFEDVIFLFRIIFGGYFRVFTLNFFVIDFFRVFLCISPKIFERERVVPSYVDYDILPLPVIGPPPPDNTVTAPFLSIPPPFPLQRHPSFTTPFLSVSTTPFPLQRDPFP